MRGSLDSQRAAKASNRRLVVVILVSSALLLQTALMAGLLWVVRDLVFIGANDFLSFYAGARLVGTDDLYNHDRVKQIQSEEIGIPSDTLPYIRPPFYAALLWPLGQFPYMTAYVIWQLLNLAALAGFVLLFPGGSRLKTLAFVWCSIPVLWSLANGQDLPLVMFWIAAALALERRNHALAAGAVLSLCSTKAHLFLLLPALVVNKQGRRLLAGLAAGGAVLTLVSFMVAGRNWPVEFFTINFSGDLQPEKYVPPNLHSLLALLPGGAGLNWIAYAIVVVMVAWVARRVLLAEGFAAVIFGSLLLTPHLFVQDFAVALPAAMIVESTAKSPLVKRLGLLLLTPLLYLLELAAPWPAGATLPVALALLVGAMWAHIRRPQVLRGRMN